MTTIETPQGPGVFISRWRNEGPVESDVLAKWKEELEWPSWLPLAEAALFMDAPELLDAMASHLSKGEQAVLGLVRRRWLVTRTWTKQLRRPLKWSATPNLGDLALKAVCEWNEVSLASSRRYGGG